MTKIVERLQEQADQVGFILELKEWRQVIPDMGRPQQIIFDQIGPQSWDIFVGVLWLRFGSPSGATDPTTSLPLESGTYEEFLTAHKLWKETGRPRILVYRCNRPPERLDQIDPEQFAKVKDFFRRFETIRPASVNGATTHQPRRLHHAVGSGEVPCRGYFASFDQGH